MQDLPASRAPAAEAEVPAYPGARAPDRSRRIDAGGLEIAVHEWGDAEARPLLLAHGGFDFARTFEVFAPLLSDAGWRVVSWDHRGHGDSEHAALYSWQADVRDACCVLDATSREPLPAVGHSKGAGVLTELIHALPGRFTRFVNLDGVPSKLPQPDVAEHERPPHLGGIAGAWLDHRRRTAAALRKPGTPEELARRRGRMNPRLSPEWLLHLVRVGARRDPDGWRWKLDPMLHFGGFGPWEPEWSLRRLRELPRPARFVLAGIREPMGSGATPESLAPWLAESTLVEVVEDSGHFLHIEQPRRIADLVLEFLAA
jgi:pimeloyl-ACP methyl ester carboxylesterase